MTQADYEAQAEQFRAGLAAMAAKPPQEQAWPEDWLTVQARVHCSSPGCPGAAGQEVTLYENGDGIYRARCGYCHTDMTNVFLLFDDGEAAGRAS